MDLILKGSFYFDFNGRLGTKQMFTLYINFRVEGTPTEWTERLKEDETEVQPAARQNFSRLRKFYENMLGRSNPDDIREAIQ